MFSSRSLLVLFSFSSRSQFFWDMIGILWKTMMFKGGHPLFSLFLWMVFPITIAMVIGWYIADMIPT